MSNTQKKNVPELRFPGFEGEWEEKKLGEVAEIYDGTHQTPKYTNEGIKFLSVENIKTLNSSKYISEEAFEKEFKIRPEFGDILMTRIGDIGTPNIVSSNEKFAYYVSLALLKTKNLNSYFLKNLILSSSIQNELWRKTLHVAFPKKINKNEIGKIKINFPTNKEQQKIGQFFSKLDRQIELEEQKLELLQQQKKGYMQKIFSQELRFKDENGEDYPEWEEKKLGDITEQSMYGIGASATRFDSKNIYIRITDIDEKSRKLKYQNLTTPDEINNKYKLKRNDILFARTGASTGKSYIHKEEKDIYNYYFAGFLIKFEINEQNSPLFIYQFTLTSKFNNWVKVMSVRSGQPGINSEEYAKLPLVLPNKLEQKKIAEFLDRFDQQIELEKQKIEILHQQKKGLLQSMFI
ncbi:TPA: restriction endonuclease subunit S [Staphylococcus aureus]|uniref:restriction endonuclease subunit S n=5 Tax=Staphylococcus aureus TaxID=1280 RepID=UPI0006BB15BA|nr:restriction endonuclease subunit S [Staphylococcus aureus]ATZ14998.1 restriction endonuclease subunit S [Staphylococcus aureus]EJX2103808.1 restriction endonuclease subunit S [Staphylococcus aureus]EKF1404961.1 restriction endonuclease subunit S [Staphylococcus aureus]MBB2534409.1 restriction endonuclease subunit S [Staphylococcus aureus]MBB2617756.1 restriction endonuclease subunit S [Staphylococcus aureus]